MNGIEKISARILADAEAEAAAIRGQAEEKAAQIAVICAGTGGKVYELSTEDADIMHDFYEKHLILLNYYNYIVHLFFQIHLNILFLIRLLVLLFHYLFLIRYTFFHFFLIIIFSTIYSNYCIIYI